ncbi:MAG: nucleotidyltransferase domain-containing protein [Pseudomonadota bacterium]|nr:nucleotidyltransferase domain-containing protein [Pseudomonadota bacterium]
MAEFQPKEVILFGSHAWGTPSEDSDVDVLVIVSASDLTPTERAVRAYHVSAVSRCRRTSWSRPALKQSVTGTAGIARQRDLRAWQGAL